MLEENEKLQKMQKLQEGNEKLRGQKAAQELQEQNLKAMQLNKLDAHKIALREQNLKATQLNRPVDILIQNMDAHKIKEAEEEEEEDDSDDLSHIERLSRVLGEGETGRGEFTLVNKKLKMENKTLQQQMEGMTLNGNGNNKVDKVTSLQQQMEGMTLNGNGNVDQIMNKEPVIEQIQPKVRKP
jgi:hypothetical protein